VPTVIEQLGQQATKAGLRLLETCVREVRRAAMKTGRYLHAKQKRRARRPLKFLRMRLQRFMSDLRRNMQAVLVSSERAIQRLEHTL
jgi:IS5 family transposase